MSATILQFQPKSRSGDPDFPGIDGLVSYQGTTATPAHPDKARLGMPGIVLTAGGDLINVGRDDLTMDHVDTAPSEYCAPDQDPA